MWILPKCGVFVLYISEYLIQVAGMKRMHIIMHLCGMRLILCVNNKHFGSVGKCYVTLHRGEHKTDTFIQGEYVASDLTLASAKLDSCDGEVRHPRRMN